MKLRFKRNCDDESMLLELENNGIVIELNAEDLNHFIQNREINDLIFTNDMSKEEKINIKLMLDNVISEILKDS